MCGIRRVVQKTRPNPEQNYGKKTKVPICFGREAMELGGKLVGIEPDRWGLSEDWDGGMEPIFVLLS